MRMRERKRAGFPRSRVLFDRRDDRSSPPRLSTVMLCVRSSFGIASRRACNFILGPIRVTPISHTRLRRSAFTGLRRVYVRTRNFSPLCYYSRRWGARARETRPSDSRSLSLLLKASLLRKLVPLVCMRVCARARAPTQRRHYDDDAARMCAASRADCSSRVITFAQRNDRIVSGQQGHFAQSGRSS